MNARWVGEAGYQGCVELTHASTRVVLDPNVGGRVLRYSVDGVEAMHIEPSQDGIRWEGSGRWQPSGGRFDFGPEYGGVPHPEIWLGRWQAEITGAGSARLMSQTVAGAGLQVLREFSLDEGQRLTCAQILLNHGPAAQPVFHWSRTFLPGGGTALAPLPDRGRFPRGYALGGPAGVIDFTPEPERNVRLRDGVLEIAALPARAKFVLDVEPGWLAYVLPGGRLFLKTFPVYSDRPYGELAANNASIWYGGKGNTPTWPGSDVAEIEAIGPLEQIPPGGRASFTEVWSLLPMPRSGDEVDLAWLRATAASLSR